MRWWLACLVIGALVACKSDAEICRRQIADCLRRCDDTGASKAPEVGATSENVMSACEKACQHCHPENASAPPSSGQPTYTGTAPQ
jgi:hypothetical protein